MALPYSASRTFPEMCNLHLVLLCLSCGLLISPLPYFTWGILVLLTLHAWDADPARLLAAATAAQAQGQAAAVAPAAAPPPEALPLVGRNERLFFLQGNQGPASRLLSLFSECDKPSSPSLPLLLLIMLMETEVYQASIDARTLVRHQSISCNSFFLQDV